MRGVTWWMLMFEEELPVSLQAIGEVGMTQVVGAFAGVAASFGENFGGRLAAPVWAPTLRD